MSATLSELRSTLAARFARIDSRFRFLVLSENHAARVEAMHLYEHLTRNITIGCDLASFYWNLERPLALESLLEAIMNADLIIVAGNQNVTPPFELQCSLHVGVLMRSAKGGALVALLGRVDLLDATPSTLQTHLESYTREANLEFFPGVYLVGNQTAACVLDSIQEQPLRSNQTQRLRS